MQVKQKNNLFIEFVKSFFSFFGIIIFILSIRWLLIEPYVIPSGSMIPTLLIHDHIVINKWAYGVRYPFFKKYLWKRTEPKRGDVVVFKSTEDSKFLIKRIVGLSGDQIFLDSQGQIWVNNEKLTREPIKNPKQVAGFYPVSARSLGARYEDYNFFLETTLKHHYRIMYKKFSYSYLETDIYKVPEGEIFVLGDNRDDSRDSRIFGSVPVDNIMGRAFGVWLSCEETFFSVRLLCNPFKMRWGRLFQSIK